MRTSYNWHDPRLHPIMITHDDSHTLPKSNNYKHKHNCKRCGL